MSAAHGKCCEGHIHDSHEIDPCMAQEIAQAERERVLYQKLKAQSDTLLMNLNIRSNKSRIRGAIAQIEEDDACSSCDEGLSGDGERQKVSVADISASQFAALHIENKDSKIFLFCVPCDMSPDLSKDQVETLFRAFRHSFESRKYPADGILVRFKSKLCVCGRCPEPESRPMGTLRSVAMILKKVPSVVVTRNGGLVGVWSAPSTEPENSLNSFLSKHF